MSFLNYLNEQRLDEADNFTELPLIWKKALTARYRNSKLLGAGSKLVQTSKRIDTDKRLNTELNKAINVLARNDGYAILESNGNPVALVMSTDHTEKEKRFSIYYVSTQAKTTRADRPSRANGWNPTHYETTSFKYADARHEVEVAVRKMLRDNYEDGDISDLNLVVKSIEVDEDRQAKQQERQKKDLEKNSDLFDNRRKAIKRYTKRVAEEITKDLKNSLPDLNDIDKAMEDALEGKKFDLKSIQELEKKLTDFNNLLIMFSRAYKEVGTSSLRGGINVPFSARSKNGFYAEYLTDFVKTLKED